MASSKDDTVLKDTDRAKLQAAHDEFGTAEQTSGGVFSVMDNTKLTFRGVDYKGVDSKSLPAWKVALDHIDNMRHALNNRRSIAQTLQSELDAVSTSVESAKELLPTSAETSLASLKHGSQSPAADKTAGLIVGALKRNPGLASALQEMGQLSDVTTSQQISDAHQAVQDCKAALEEVDTEVKDLSNKVAEVFSVSDSDWDTKLSEMEAKLTNLVEVHAKVSQELEASRNSIRELEGISARKQAALDAVNGDLDGTRSSLRVITVASTAQRRNLTALNSRFNQLQHRNGELQHEAHQERRTLTRTLTKLQTLRKSCHHHFRRAARLANRLTFARTALQGEWDTIAQLRVDMGRSERRRLAQQATINDQSGTLIEGDEAIESLRAELGRLQTEHATQLEALQSQHERQVENLRDEHETQAKALQDRVKKLVEVDGILLKKVGDHEKTIQTLDAEKTALDLSLSRKSSELKDALRLLSLADSRASTDESTKKEQTQQIQHLEDLAARLTRNRDETVLRANQTSTELITVTAENAALSGRVNALEDLETRLKQKECVAEQQRAQLDQQVGELTNAAKAHAANFEDLRTKFQKQFDELLTCSKTVDELSKRLAPMETLQLLADRLPRYQTFLKVIALSETESFDFEKLEAGFMAAADFSQSLESVVTAPTRLSDIQGLCTEVVEQDSALGYAMEMLQMLANSSDWQAGHSRLRSFATALQDADGSVLQKCLPILYALLHEILVAHAQSPLISALLRDLNEDLDLSSVLSYGMLQVLDKRCRGLDGQLTTEVISDARERNSLLVLDGINIIVDIDKLVLIKLPLEIGIVLPCQFEMNLDPIEGPTIQFKDAPVVGTSQITCSFENFDHITGLLGDLNNFSE